VTEHDSEWLYFVPELGLLLWQVQRSAEKAASSTLQDMPLTRSPPSSQDQMNSHVGMIPLAANTMSQPNAVSSYDSTAPSLTPNHSTVSSLTPNHRTQCTSVPEARSFSPEDNTDSGQPPNAPSNHFGEQSADAGVEGTEHVLDEELAQLLASRRAKVVAAQQRPARDSLADLHNTLRQLVLNSRSVAVSEGLRIGKESIAIE
jgi:hypothetical protein